MHAAFGLQVAVGVVAGDFERGPFDPRLVTGLDVENFGFHAVLFDPTLIHAHEHVGPIACFGAAGAGMNCKVGGIAVELAAEQAGDLEGIECFFEIVTFFDHFLLGLAAGVTGGLLRGHFVEDGEVADAGLEAAERFDQSAQTRNFGHVRLGLVLVVPEPGFGHAAFNGCQFGGELVVVKETSATASDATRARRCRGSRIEEETWEIRKKN